MHNLLNCDCSGCQQDKLLHKYLSSHEIAQQPQTLSFYTSLLLKVIILGGRVVMLLVLFNKRHKDGSNKLSILTIY